MMRPVDAYTAVAVGLEVLRNSSEGSAAYRLWKQNESAEGCSKVKMPETCQVQERLVSALEHMQVPKWERTRYPEE